LNQLFDNLGGTELAGNKMKEAGGAHALLTGNYADA